MIAMAMQENPPNKLMEVRDVIRNKCMAAQFASRASVHKVLRSQPGQLAFGRNVFSPFTIHVDWDEILNHHRAMSDKNNIRENHGRKRYDYNINNKILILKKEHMRDKLDPTTLDEGPWTITTVFANGTANVNRNGYIGRMNIRRLRPFNN
jgi:hypothetical protein